MADLIESKTFTYTVVGGDIEIVNTSNPWVSYSDASEKLRAIQDAGKVADTPPEQFGRPDMCMPLLTASQRRKRRHRLRSKRR